MSCSYYKIAKTISLLHKIYIFVIDHDIVNPLRNRLQGFIVSGLPGGEKIFGDSLSSSRYQEAVIDITIPESLSNTVFSGINISVSSMWQHLQHGTFLTLCEVKVFLGN